jgi:tRNA pseudouridine65 synthase
MLPILFQDEHLVAMNKPAGLLVHRTVLDDHDRLFAVQLLRQQIGQRVYPVHRLDRGTSGVLMFALNREVARALAVMFENRQVRKTYVAVVRGHPPLCGEIDHALVRRPDDVVWIGQSVSGDPQEAVTRFRRLATAELPYPVDRYPTSRYALVELEPLTGRRHQLRRHLQHIAHPVIGDATYGKGRHNRLFQTLFGCRRMLLACTELRLTHPVSGECLTLSAPLAGDFSRLIERIGWAADVPPQWLSFVSNRP